MADKNVGRGDREKWKRQTSKLIARTHLRMQIGLAGEKTNIKIIKSQGLSTIYIKSTHFIMLKKPKDIVLVSVSACVQASEIDLACLTTFKNNS